MENLPEPSNKKNNTFLNINQREFIWEGKDSSRYAKVKQYPIALWLISLKKK